MSRTPKVSVLIPSYNYGHLLDETISSVLDQTFTDFEIVIVDNASSDNTQEVVAKYLSDSRVRYYRNAVNIGLSGNWNKCLEYATGDYIKYLCADDKFHPFLLAKFVEVLDREPQVAVVGCQKQWFGTNVVPKIISIPFSGEASGRSAIAHTVKLNFNFIGEPSVPMFRRTNFNNEKFELLEYVTDWEMWLRQLMKGSCYLLPEVLVFVRRHGTQQQVLMKKQCRNYLEMYWLYKNIRDDKFGHFPELKGALDELIHLYATKCGFGFYRMLPGLTSKTQWKAIKQLAKVALKEKVLFTTGVLKIFGEKMHSKKQVARSKVMQVESEFNQSKKTISI